MKLIRATAFLVLVSASFSANSQARSTERVPTSLIEDGKPISLEMVVIRPSVDSAGPFPTLVFNHGSTGLGNNPSLFSIPGTAPSVASYFNSRGWLVVFPQRRGRGGSDGLYDEGFTKSRARYSISPERSLAGLDRALEDIDEVVKYLRTNPLVDSDRMLIGGVSRGGLLSIVYAGTRADVFVGSVNFVGGWIARFPGSGIVRLFNDYMKKINTVSFVRGANPTVPTIWLYGENDSFYSMKHSRQNFDAFISAGGVGTFHQYLLGDHIDGHSLSYFPYLWRADLDAFLDEL